MVRTDAATAQRPDLRHRHVSLFPALPGSHAEHDPQPLPNPWG